MIWLLIGAILGGAMGWMTWDEYYSNFPQWVRMACLSLMGVGFGLTAGIVVGLCFGASTTDVSRSNLGALNDGSAIEGHFFLGSGTIDEKQVFSYYEQIAPNEYKLSRIDANNYSYQTTVLEEDVDAPYVETTGKLNTTPTDFWRIGMSGDYSLDRVTFHVPKGSIKTGVVLDAQ